MFLEDCKIIENKQVANSYYLMKVIGNKTVEAAKPGQFYMLQCKNGATILRRPISLHYADKEKNILEFYYEVKGAGTNEFKSLKNDDTINIQGPLGNGFSTDSENKNIVVIGGGMGIAPTKFLLETLSKNNNVFFIAGGRNADSVKILENIDLANIKSFVATDDGSVGTKGNVTIPLKEIIKNNKIDAIYTCGPHVMMLAVGKIANENNIYCELSLEERMACGVKACVGCSIMTKVGMRKVCHDGPVFDSKIIID